MGQHNISWQDRGRAILEASIGQPLIANDIYLAVMNDIPLHAGGRVRRNACITPMDLRLLAFRRWLCRLTVHIDPVPGRQQRFLLSSTVTPYALKCATCGRPFVGRADYEMETCSKKCGSMKRYAQERAEVKL
jgi:hypothetical protein